VDFDKFLRFKLPRRYGGFNWWQGQFACPISILAFGFLLCAFLTPCPVYGSNEVDSYIKSVFQLVEMHREALPRLIAPANATADAVTHGGAFYLAGDKGWIDEGDGRAGGLMMVRPLSASKPPAKGDVVWLAYSPESYGEDAQKVKELEGQGCLVVAFGPKLASGAPQFAHWIDSFTPPTAAADFTRMGNIISLWTLTAEVAASVSRQGKTPAFFQSDSIEGARERNILYRGLAFHDGVPQMAPIQPGDLSHAYVAFLQEMLKGIQESELQKIMKVGQEMSRRAAEGHPALLMLIGHMMPSTVDHNSRLFRYLDIHKERGDVQTQMPQGGYFVFLGYVGVYLDLWRYVRRAGATAAWIVSPLPTGVGFGQWGDVVIDQHWRIGDCAVEAPGYDMRILPPSGIAQIFIYETLIRAAGAH
jgi:uncharacterized phosphosugar-binding protein